MNCPRIPVTYVTGTPRKSLISGEFIAYGKQMTEGNIKTLPLHRQFLVPQIVFDEIQIRRRVLVILFREEVANEISTTNRI